MHYRVVVTDTAFSKDLSAFKSVLSEQNIETKVFDPEIKDIRQLHDYDAIHVQQLPFREEVVRNLDSEKCKLVIKFGVGYENLDLDALTKAGIHAANVPDYGPETVGQHTLYFMLSLAKHGNEYHHRVITGRDLELGSDTSGEDVWTNKSRMPSISLDKCILGILGYGRIGKKVAHIARSTFQHIIACDPYIDKSEFEDDVRSVDLDSLLKTADFVTVHIPLFTEEQQVYSGYPDYKPKGIYYRPTKYLIDEKMISKMKDGSFLINTSRGGVVKESAVIDALIAGKLAGVALDVFESEPLPRHHRLRDMIGNDLPENHPLRKKDQEKYNIVLTPHSAYYTEGILSTIEKLMAEEIIRVLIEGKPPKNLINPDVLNEL